MRFEAKGNLQGILLPLWGRLGGGLRGGKCHLYNLCKRRRLI